MTLPRSSFGMKSTGGLTSLRAAPALSEESINAVAHLNVANRELREYRDGKKEKK